MTNLLIPTDFTPASLKLAAQAVTTLNRPVNIILFHAFDMPFYYRDMIRREAQPSLEMISDSFWKSCRQLKEQYPSLINKIHYRCMHGNSNALFRNFADANAIDLIACPPNYLYSKIHPNSLNPVPFFKKSRIPLLQDFGTVQRPVPVTAQVKKEMGFAAVSQ